MTRKERIGPRNDLVFAEVTLVGHENGQGFKWIQGIIYMNQRSWCNYKSYAS